VRSLDTTAALVDGVLEVLLQASRALTQPGGIAEALAAVAEVCASTIADYCSIGVVIEGLEREEFGVSAGEQPERQVPEVCRLMLPLVSGRRRYGAIICLTSDPSGFDSLSRRTIEVIAAQLAVVVAAYSAAEREHQVAERLQRALLPPSFPKAEGCEFHAIYRPASEEAAVGGDWYDVFVLPDGRIAVSIGDVAGHGLDAAVVMGEVRQAVRTAGMREGVTPAEILEYVNDLVRARNSIGMVTAIFGVYDPQDSALIYACAGHPPPMIALSGGAVAILPGGGLPLGCAERVEAENWSFTIPQNGRAIFYTDGLTENERDVIAGERRLVDAVRSLEWNGDADPAQAIAQHVLADTGNRDDAAVFVLTRRGPVDRYVFSAATVVAPLSRAIVANELAGLALSEDRRFGVLVAVGEAVANAVEHAYRGRAPGLIRLAVEKNAQQLVVTVEDYGRWRPFVRREERGRGIGIMHAFTDGVQIRSTSESTAIVLRMELPA